MKLGPLLGLEDDYKYTVTFLSEANYEPGELELSIDDRGTLQTVICSHKDKLHTCHIYRFEFSVDPYEKVRHIKYAIAHGEDKLSNHDLDNWSFSVPGIKDIPKIGFASCNGSGSQLPKPGNPANYVMWEHMWEAHTDSHPEASGPFHCLLMGGDQVYADPIWKKVEYFSQGPLRTFWYDFAVMKHKIPHDVRDDLVDQIKAFYEKLYIDSWGQTFTKKILASVPTIMMWDDHDIFDGWGSHNPKLQESDIFQCVFSVAKDFFEKIQVRTKHNSALVNPSHDYSQRVRFRNYEIIALDNRSHRTRKDIMSGEQKMNLNSLKDKNLFEHTDDVHKGTGSKHQTTLLFLIPVPVAHLNFSEFAEGFLRIFWRQDFRNKLSLNDDAIDHWDHKRHRGEQLELLNTLFNIGDSCNPKYMHIISGDVHVAGTGKIKTYVDKATNSYKVINQLISSPMVHSPAPKAINKLGSHSSHFKKKYDLEVFEFGYASGALKVINDRNYGYLYKPKNHGIMFYLALESEGPLPDFDQPSQYVRKAPSPNS